MSGYAFEQGSKPCKTAFQTVLNRFFKTHVPLSIAAKYLFYQL